MVILPLFVIFVLSLLAVVCLSFFIIMASVYAFGMFNLYICYRIFMMKTRWYSKVIITPGFSSEQYFRYIINHKSLENFEDTKGVKIGKRKLRKYRQFNDWPCCSFDISCGKIDHKVYKYIRVKKNWAFVLANKDNTMANPEFIYAEFLLFWIKSPWLWCLQSTLFLI